MAVVYKDPAIRLSRRTRPKIVREVKLVNPEDKLGIINGIMADSSYEWNFARALWTLGWTFDYQVPLFGGRMVRGGVVLDFLIPTRPAQTVLNPIGEYWHQDTDTDYIEDLRIMDYLGQGTRILRPGTTDSKTYELALAYAMKEIGRA